MSDKTTYESLDNRRAGIGGGGLNQMVRVCAAELRQGKIGSSSSFEYFRKR